MLSKTKAMVELATETKFLTTESEIEALLLEAELVQSYQPHFNLRLKDDKSPLYILITKDEFPLVKLVRKPEIIMYPKATYFGPFQSGTQARMLLKITRPIFGWCDSPGSGRACFYYHLELCTGACVGHITASDYTASIESLKTFLRGKQNQLIRSLRDQIESASLLLQYEQAQVYKRQLDAVIYQKTSFRLRQRYQILPNLPQDMVTHQLVHAKKLLTQLIPLPKSYQLRRIECYDISHYQGDFIVGSMVTFTDGEKNGSLYRRFKIRNTKVASDPQRIGEVIKRRSTHQEWGIPDLIVIDGSIAQVRAAKKNCPWDIPIIGLVKHPDRLVISRKVDAMDAYAYHRLNPKDPSTRLFTTIRDESHRFANTYQQNLYAKSLTT
jgi:excinuclease ABC subunit C